MNNSGKIVIGVAAGLAVGTALGILFAPAKGSDTRKKIMEEGKDLADKLTEKAKAIKKMCTDCKETETA